MEPYQTELGAHVGTLWSQETCFTSNWKNLRYFHSKPSKFTEEDAELFDVHELPEQCLEPKKPAEPVPAVAVQDEDEQMDDYDDDYTDSSLPRFNLPQLTLKTLRCIALLKKRVEHAVSWTLTTSGCTQIPKPTSTVQIPLSSEGCSVLLC